MENKGMKRGYIALTEADKNFAFEEKFKAQTGDKDITWPKVLGVIHPFEFEDAEKTYKRVSIVSGAVNKYVDHIVGEFTIKAKNENAEALIKSFIKDTEFSTVLREWIREALIKGNGFMELDLDNAKLQVINANQMYVKRDKNGKIRRYNQFAGQLKKFLKEEIVDFEPNQIAHLKLNKIAGEAYGLGIVWPNERAIETFIMNVSDLEKLINRKAGSPYHVKVGVPGQMSRTEDVDEVKQNLTYLTNRTEWVTDANVAIDIKEFGQLGDSLIRAIENNMLMILAGMEVPEVLLGSGQLNEGIAKVQLEGWQRKIAALQDEIECVIEEKIFKPLLNQNDLDEDVEFIWNLPGESEINTRLEKLMGLLNNSIIIDENMRRMVQLEIARLLDFKNAEGFLLQPEDTPMGPPLNSPEAKREAEITQPEVPGAKPNANEHKHGDLCEHGHEHASVQEFIKKQGDKWCVISHDTGKNMGCYDSKEEAEKRLSKLKQSVYPMNGEGCGQQLTIEESREMSIQEFVNIQEIAGFNYSDYLIKILQELARDKFDNLSAITKQDIEEGLFSKNEIGKLRIIIKDGFKKNKTIREIETDIKDNIDIKDRVKEGQIVVPKEARPNVIARSETVRLANMGLVNLYKENKIEKVRFLAAVSERTCPICNSLNGQIFEINKLDIGSSQPPIHPSCRCSLTSVVE